ncbi:MAG: protein-L-isoaspartate(D-aspartate) O-methyltransferase [Candidatus Bipolaricaulota bacterium]|nr:protein-L-isoaspartate(D-aspartate) O-methyltransferase [Candidatus Bipolaricaulota bacterium]MCS7275237.1 protein-L-isoaspartate(D-aspartate) O-methyltransferase [Candidatus Bipolaricaulota bacterium]MDW8111061.1 protein-L-isoaspartate(D-aspartate) O-methyltransferase [Candidatus Bipolaricaulota bacterium]MDW8329568.1 protein-L-isoaspartate(D-aspartate) O-methyltransferase [Candidatus Bipolaricaulota bacterium]
MAREPCGSPQRDRQRMVQHLAAQGITDKNVLHAMQRIPRHLFVANSLWDQAYADHPLPIEQNQTISQPYIVALMTQALQLQKSDRVLEIGTGSGYQTAILAELAGQVYTIERFPQLSQKAQRLLREAGYTNIRYRVGDGSLGWPEEAPFDKIIVTAAAPEVPSSLLAQLADPGRMVIPVGGRQVQTLLLIRRENQELFKEELCACSFLPLVGKEGWPEEESIESRS